MRIAQWIIYCPKEWIRASLHFTFVRQFRKKKFFCVSKLVREGKTRKVFFLLFHRPLGTDYFICMCHAGKNKISQGNQLERLNISWSNLWCKYFPFFSYFLKIYLESVYNQLICSKSLASYQLTAAKFCTVQWCCLQLRQLTSEIGAGHQTQTTPPLWRAYMHGVHLISKVAQQGSKT